MRERLHRLGLQLGLCLPDWCFEHKHCYCAAAAATAAHSSEGIVGSGGNDDVGGEGGGVACRGLCAARVPDAPAPLLVHTRHRTRTNQGCARAPHRPCTVHAQAVRCVLLTLCTVPGAPTRTD